MFFSYNESFSMSFLALYEGFPYYLLVNSETLDKDKVKTRPLAHIYHINPSG